MGHIEIFQSYDVEKIFETFAWGLSSTRAKKLN